MAIDRVAVVSFAQTQLRPRWDNAQHIDLISAVVWDVFKGTGLDLADVDFVFDAGSDVLDGRSISNCGFLGAMGAHHKEESRVEEDGLWAMTYGIAKIASGAARVGLIIAYSKPSEAQVDLFYASQVEPFYQRPVGFDHRCATGMQAQRYLGAHGVDETRLADLVARRWADAGAQGRVWVETSPSAQDVLAAPMAARPLTELGFSRPVDGAVAVLIASEDVARRMARQPVYVTGIGTAMDRHAFATRDAGRLAACEAAAQSAYKRAGWARPAPDLVELSASSVVTELMVVESLGLAEPGKAIEAAAGAGTVINPSGGSLPADPIMATGLVRLAEASRRLQAGPGEAHAKPRQAIVHGAGGVGMQSHCVLTLEV